MVPYLYTDLTALFRSLMKIISRDEVLENCSIGYKLLQTNICQNNLRSRKDLLLDLLPKAHSWLGKERFFTKEGQRWVLWTFCQMYQNYGWQTEGKMPTRLSSGAQCCGFQPNNCCELQRVISREKAKKFASAFGVAEVDSRSHCWHSHNNIFIHERRCWILDVTALPALDEFYFDIVKVP